MRPYWKGYLKLALVSCPIALHAACSSAERVAFRQVNKTTGNRLRQQLFDEETREPVDSKHKGRGYEVAKGQYLIVEDAEFEAIEIESTRVIEIDSFVPRQQIDQRFFDTPYYVAPNEPVAQEAFAVIREAMRHKTMVAPGRLVLCKRERVIALEPYGKGLLGTTLRYAYEVRDAKDYFSDLPELALAPDMPDARRADPGAQSRPVRPESFPRPLRGGAARAPQGRTGRCGAGGKAKICRAPASHQPHGGAAAEPCTGPETADKGGPATPATRKRA
jgi:DNA end-binding protein Ku